MKIVLAIDSFKGSLSSLDAGKAAAEGFRRVCPDADCRIFSVADGGEGTVDALAVRPDAVRRSSRVSDPLSRPVDAAWCTLCPDSAAPAAVMEMAAASGLPLLKPEERDPMIASTYGFGELIRIAVNEGCRDFIIGIGGSATNDGGAGMLQALGFGLYKADGSPIGPGAAGLADLASVDTAGILPALADCRFRIACDVKNPLCGPNGCSAVFAPQKGALAEDIEKMDGWLGRYAAILKKAFPDADPEQPGSGAAGGLGFALAACLGGELLPGAPLILETVGLAKAIADADLVITGEGRIDFQTAMGKTPQGVAAIAKRFGKPCIAFAGSIGKGAEACHAAGIDAVFPILRSVCTLKEAMDPMTAAANMAAAAEQALRAMLTFGR